VDDDEEGAKALQLEARRSDTVIPNTFMIGGLIDGWMD